MKVVKSLIVQKRNVTSKFSGLIECFLVLYFEDPWTRFWRLLGSSITSMP